MIHVVIGHRGVGKSSLGERIKGFSHDLVFDLDEEIIKESGRSIQEIFEKEGESRFRQWERKSYIELINRLQKKEQSAWIIVGAGFQDWDLIKEDDDVIFLQRNSDQLGRVFFDRPRLEKKLSDLQESKSRFKQRQMPFELKANRTLLLEEGFHHHFFLEKGILLRSEKLFDADITLVGLTKSKRKQTFESLKKYQFRLVELRDDLLDKDEIESYLQMECCSYLLSLRKRNQSSWLKSKNLKEFLNEKRIQIDWALELGEPPNKLIEDFSYISYHGREGLKIEETNSLPLMKYCHFDLKLKWSPFVKNFNELKQGHQWMLAKPSQRIFLPRSLCGRWTWYRLLMAKKFPDHLNFVREGRGSAIDQPTLFEWLRVRTQQSSSFAAILGQPVDQSWTPGEHYSFFAERERSLYRVDMGRRDATSENFHFLIELGLEAAAVTSPLKEFLFFMKSQASQKAEELKSANTLLVKENKIKVHNTDCLGFQKFWENHFSHQEKDCVVWGGGGVLNMLKSIGPQWSYYSARTGDLRKGSFKSFKKSPQVLIWACGLNEKYLENLPPEWEPQYIVDLNYIDSSPARTLAKKVQAHYISGLEFFKNQAEEQRRFWSGINSK